MTLAMAKKAPEDPRALEFGARLKRLMASRGETNSSLARKANVEPPTVSRFVNGHRIPRTDILGKIARALDCTVDDLIPPDPKLPPLPTLRLVPDEGLPSGLVEFFEKVPPPPGNRRR